MTTSTGAIRLPLRSYPGMNPFVLDWLDGDARATKFLRREAGGRTSRAAASGSPDPDAFGRTLGGTAPVRGRPDAADLEIRPPRSRQVDPALAAALVESNRRWGIDAESSVRAWQEGADTFVAGQQVGLGGGPLYTLAKIATLVKLKREAEARGAKGVAFFWLATEDHDYDEVATLSVPLRGGNSGNGDLAVLRARRRPQERFAVGRLEVPDDLRRELDRLLDLGNPAWLRDGITFGDSFAELIASVVGNEVVLIDALLPELRRAGAPLLGAIGQRAVEVQSALAARAAELREAGYHEQVTARGDDYTLLFELGADGIRRPLEGGAAAPPETISTSALTRPLLQDAVLAPDVFVGGPAEVAYYAQVGALHELLEVAQPRVALRGHAVVAPYRLLRSAEKHRLPIDRVFATPESLVEPSETEAVGEVEATVAQAQRDLMAAVDRISELALPAEHALAGRIQRSVGHLEYHLEKLRERSVRALLRRDRERFATARKLVATLYPDGQVQDRVVSWLALWSRYGQDLVDRLVEDIEPDSATFTVIDI